MKNTLLTAIAFCALSFQFVNAQANYSRSVTVVDEYQKELKKQLKIVSTLPNDSNTWKKVKNIASSLASSYWRRGKILGPKLDHAFLVRCGLGETMTGRDVSDGILKITIGLAVLKPAEFEIINLQLKIIGGAHVINKSLNQVEQLSDSDLIKTLHLEISSKHIPLTYKAAGDILFLQLDSKNGNICGVYSPLECFFTEAVPSPKLMNIEHSWPQNLGANGVAKSDLHHLFIASSETNSMRSSLPFCDVEMVKWTNGHSKRGYSQFNEHCFEPPAGFKGNIARALLYFSIRYQKSIDQNQETFLRQWHSLDPVDADEINRNKAIEVFQKNKNPFVDNPELVDRISDF